MIDDNIPAPPKSQYIPDEIVLYGIRLNKTMEHARFDVGLGKKAEVHLSLFSEKGITASIVLAYAYGFDGHCYRLDSNRIFLVTGNGPEEAKGGGFDGSKDVKMWRIKASTQILEITMNFGDARNVILDAQLPGKRSPNSYAITLRMAHRDGRFSRD
ncbi:MULTISPECIES: hypothetical protein [Rhizobium]|uniref:hypothetical protein n=1 Tax=Rhizobium TaxID=379 RepID=UPI00124E335F|nr:MULTISPECIES: hypothetical protein [Rhizobium]KAF5881980.1 hypothetical protein FY112_27755 [Rhizobium sp. PEPV16]NKM97180.1 hypothetical protein [Rhizobium leguminosarum bv. viciae]